MNTETMDMMAEDIAWGIMIDARIAAWEDTLFAGDEPEDYEVEEDFEHHVEWHGGMRYIVRH